MLFSDSDLQCITDKIIMRKRDADVLFCHFNTIDVDKRIDSVKVVRTRCLVLNEQDDR